MIYVLYFVHIICCLFLILVVLLQQGKGADLSVFGGGTTQAAFGARSTATLLHKATVGFFVVFILTTLSIGIVQRGSGSSSIMSAVEAEASEPAAVEEAPATDAEPVDTPVSASDAATAGEEPAVAEPAVPEPEVPADEN